MCRTVFKAYSNMALVLGDPDHPKQNQEIHRVLSEAKWRRQETKQIHPEFSALTPDVTSAQGKKHLAADLSVECFWCVPLDLLPLCKKNPPAEYLLSEHRVKWRN